MCSGDENKASLVAEIVLGELAKSSQSCTLATSSTFKD